MDYSSMTLEQLEAQAEELNAELCHISLAINDARSKEKQKAWEVLETAIINYLKYDDSIYINWGGFGTEATEKNINFPHIGEIYLENEER